MAPKLLLFAIFTDSPRDIASFSGPLKIFIHIDISICCLVLTCYEVTIPCMWNPENIHIYSRNNDTVLISPVLPQSDAMSVDSGLVLHKIYKLAILTTATWAYMCF